QIRETLGAIALLPSPLSASSLARLLCVPAEDVHRTLYELHSIVDVPRDRNRPVRLHHPSFRDFLLNRERCSDERLWVDEKSTHKKLVGRCLELMSAPGRLRQDLCGIGVPSALAAEMEPALLEQCLPKELQYACLYWINHLAKSGAKLCDNDEVHNFLKGHCLHWIEALGWMGNVSEGIHAISSL
ncbi:hypothetical protein T440DRAFT_354237, partial [Plenodomus tracheiphilus IPT5]